MCPRAEGVYRNSCTCATQHRPIWTLHHPQTDRRNSNGVKYRPLSFNNKRHRGSIHQGLNIDPCYCKTVECTECKCVPALNRIQQTLWSTCWVTDLNSLIQQIFYWQLFCLFFREKGPQGPREAVQQPRWDRQTDESAERVGEWSVFVAGIVAS